MKKYKITIISTVTIIAVAVTSIFCTLFAEKYISEYRKTTAIKNGFSNELAMWLWEEHGILIPLHEAEMVKGDNVSDYFGIKTVIILFRIPVDPNCTDEKTSKKYLYSKMNLNKEKWEIRSVGVEPTVSSFIRKKYGGNMPYEISCVNMSSAASLHFKIEEDHYLIRIIASNPNGKNFP